MMRGRHLEDVTPPRHYLRSDPFGERVRRLPNAPLSRKTRRALERYIPVLMGMARIYWDREHYSQVERILRQAAEFASEHDTWKLNMAVSRGPATH